jgi:hypothetical protein
LPFAGPRLRENAPARHDPERSSWCGARRA